ncbi:MAG: DUF362 domain-containing protein, partial [Candidatus Margulisbacteria bacterium]|nr:DUF362 domain-containing protein [Candidatus Margulisiibacteriota bacterium]
AFSAEVYIIKTTNRVEGIKALVEKAGLPDLFGKKIIIKPNFNSDDPFPATTHLDTIKTVVRIIKASTPESITIVERSGMGNTGDVLESRGLYALASAEGIEVVNLDRLEKDDWVNKGWKGDHWLRGFMVPRIVLEADYVINLPCLKTHRFGGDFTMALKNHVGTVAKWQGPYNYMWELHSSGHQRKMIAEINKAVPSDLIIMDGIKGFSTEGPDKGKLIEPGIIVLATDPVANDAVGVAVLRLYGTTDKVAKGMIFDQEQLKRAGELGLGVKSPEEIQLMAVNEQAASMVGRIKLELRE